MRSIVQRIKHALLKRNFKKQPFQTSGDYWERRYAASGHSGAGSYGKLASFKAEVLNRFVAEHDVQSVIEHGCGDGNQLKLAEYPAYVGFDVSPTILEACRKRFKGDATKSFKHVDEYAGEQADLSMSLDVIYHLVEDEVFDAHMRRVFESARRFAVIYSSDEDVPYQPGSHVRQRAFTKWIDEHQPPFKLLSRIENALPFEGEVRRGSMADFFIYERTDDA